MRSCVVDELLGHASPGHLVFDVAESRVVLAEVVGHVAVGVDAQQLGPGVDEELDQMEVATGGCRML